MRRIKLFTVQLIAVCLFAAFTATANSVSGNPTLVFQKMSGNPTDEAGYANGVSACFAGKLQEKMVMAGGCNFPGIPAAKGGKKVFYRGIYVANLNANQILHWKKAGELPAPAAYGVTIADNDRLIFIGGSNEQGSLAAVHSLTVSINNTLKLETLPSLPFPMDNMSGAIIGKTIYIAGGKVNGKSSASMFCLNLDNLKEGWRSAPEIPGGPRMQAVMAANSGNIYLWGGFAPAFDGKGPTLSTDGYRFSPETKKWTQLPAPKDNQGKAVSLGGGVATRLNDSLILCTGGVDKDIFLEALQRESLLKGEQAKIKAAEYLSHPAEWYRFNDKVFVYNTLRGKWRKVSGNSLMARAGASIVGDKNTFYLINGELKPGIRTPEITRLKLVSSGDYTGFVNPMIGTGGHGHTFPGPTVPFGMIQPGPDTRINGWDACSGYYYNDSTINGFSHTHLSGTGCGDYGEILIMPTVGKQQYLQTSPETQILPYASPFSHANETAVPGYYSVYLDRYRVQAELTATKRAAMHRYTFPASKESGFVFDLDYSLQDQRNRDMKLEIIGDTVIKGYKNTAGWAWDHQVCFYAVFSKPFKCKLIEDTVSVGAIRQKRVLRKALLQFETTQNEQVLVKVAISPVDTEGARKNLTTEMPDWNFDNIQANACKDWNRYLQKIEISTKDEEQKTIFYTAMYHTGISPNLFSDVDGRYRGMDKKIHQTTPDKPVYTIFSLWDTFRAFHPLMTIIDPKLNTDFINSLLKKYREGGILPMWELAANYTGTMIGYNAVPVIVDAYMKGNRDFDVAEAFKACQRSSMYDTTNIAATRYVRDNGLMPISKYYKNTLGYVPCDKENESVAKGLEYAYDDWCIARLAESLGDKANQNKYDKLAKNYRNYFDPGVGFMRGKDSNGKWRTPFSPLASTHRSDDYCEGTAWQWTWFVPHDVDGLKKLMGGEKKFITKLDSLFTLNASMEGENVSADISGLIGQYAHGNEPSHHIIYFYNYAHQPWKAQALVDSVLYTLYHNDPNGLSGNEDCGQMSAWYILNAMGFYQPCPGNPTWSIGRPVFDKVVINLPNGKIFEISTIGQKRQNKYIQSVTLNGKPLNKPFFAHKDIMNGGKMIITMSSRPTKWGTK